MFCDKSQDQQLIACLITKIYKENLQNIYRVLLHSETAVQLDSLNYVQQFDKSINCAVIYYVCFSEASTL